jgi:hypothetical protein
MQLPVTIVTQRSAKDIQDISASYGTKARYQQALHPEQELGLLRCIEQLIKRGLPPTRAIIRDSALLIARREVGVHWADRFMQRHPDNLISKQITGIDNSRHEADPGTKYWLYFDLLREKIDQHRVEPRYT